MEQWGYSFYGMHGARFNCLIYRKNEDEEEWMLENGRGFCLLRMFALPKHSGEESCSFIYVKPA